MGQQAACSYTRTHKPAWRRGAEQQQKNGWKTSENERKASAALSSLLPLPHAAPRKRKLGGGNRKEQKRKEYEEKLKEKEAKTQQVQLVTSRGRRRLWKRIFNRSCCCCYCSIYRPLLLFFAQPITTTKINPCVCVCPCALYLCVLFCIFCIFYSICPLSFWPFWHSGASTSLCELRARRRLARPLEIYLYIYI